jgi:hypothetical protein
VGDEVGRRDLTDEASDAQLEAAVAMLGEAAAELEDV